MRSIFVSLLAVIILAAAAPVFAVDDTYYGARLQVITKYDTEEYVAVWGDTFADDWAECYLNLGQLNPVWSPDGKTIAMNGYAGFGIWTVPAEGGKPTLVYNNYHKQQGYMYQGEPFGIGFMQALAFTPDGKEFTFLDYILDPARGSAVTDNDDGGITVWHPVPIIRNINLATGEIHTVVEEGVEGVWSPDGRYFVYYWQHTNYTQPTPEPYDPAKYKIQWGIKVLDTQTGEIKTLAMWGCYPSITPDGKYVIYTSNTSVIEGDIIMAPRPYNLYRIPITGGAHEQLTFYTDNTECTSAAYGEVSPNGEWMLFCGTFKEWDTNVALWKSGLCVLNLNTGETFKAFPRSEVSEGKGQWSPDGKKFAYTLGGIWSQTPRIYTVDFQPTPFWKPAAVAETTPVDFAIKGNYPNPFNPSTTIEFSLPSHGPANLTIYNVNGQKVRELVNGQTAAGMHSVAWDGRDESGKAVSSGIYLSRLTMGNRTVTSRMLLAK